ncbi:EEF1A lysine methyltransferase 2 [Plecturocebus cupreus]
MIASVTEYAGGSCGKGVFAGRSPAPLFYHEGRVYSALHSGLITECHRVSLCHQGWGAVAGSGLTAAFTSQAQAILPPQPLKVSLTLSSKLECSRMISAHCNQLLGSKCWDYRHEPLCLAPSQILSDFNKVISFQFGVSVMCHTGTSSMKKLSHVPKTPVITSGKAMPSSIQQGHHEGWSAVAQSQLPATYYSQVQMTPASASRVAGITGEYYHVWLIFVFLVETEFHYVGQAGLKLLTSTDLPASPSQSTGSTG